MKEYYIVEEGNPSGPLSYEDLKEKNITKGTLVWARGFEEWKRASEVKELNDLIESKPPPIPNNKLLSKENKNFLTKELRIISKLLLYSMTAGLLSFFIFYLWIYDADKYNDFNVEKRIKRDGNTASGIDLSNFPFVWSGGMSNSDVKRNIKRRKEYYTEKSLESSSIAFLIIFSSLLVYRYANKKHKID